MRALAREYGASYSITEVMIDRFANEVKGTGKTHHYFRVEDSDHPVGAQLMGSDPESFVPAASRLVDAGFDVIDINFGCPVKSALGGCRGGYHLSQPETAIEIIHRVRETVPESIPVTVKMRRGLDDTQQSRDHFFHILEAAFLAGISSITVHGRTVEQKYRGPSNWEFLHKVKEFAGQRTILGSGDLFSAEACVRMLKETGVDGVTIARGAIGNPWIFRQAVQLLDNGIAPHPPSILEQRIAIERHFALAMQNNESKALGTIKKFGYKYARLHPRTSEIRKAFGVLKTTNDWNHLLASFYSHDGPGQFPEIDETNG